MTPRKRTSPATRGQVAPSSSEANKRPPAKVAGQIINDAGGRPRVDEGGRPLVAGSSNDPGPDA